MAIPSAPDIHEVAKHEAVNMFTAVGYRRIKVEPRASDHGDDRAGIEVEGFSGGNTLWFDIGAASTSRAIEGITVATFRASPRFLSSAISELITIRLRDACPAGSLHPARLRARRPLGRRGDGHF